MPKKEDIKATLTYQGKTVDMKDKVAAEGLVTEMVTNIIERGESMTKKEETKSQGKLIRTTNRSLPCKLTETEIKLAAEELAQVTQDIAAEEDRQTDIKAQMKATLTKFQSRQTELAIKVSRKVEYRPVDIAIELFGDGQETFVRETRKDTGEIVDTRPATDDEKQMQLAVA